MKIENLFKPSYLKEKNISKRTQKILREFAREAHEIDKTQSITFYYQIFLERYKKRGIDKKIHDFFGDKIIEI